MGGSRTLVLNIDRDDDIGFKAAIESPVVGRKACLDAAVRFALADPEDSDLNAIFQAVSTYDRLISEGEDAEVAVIGGNHFRFIEGDRKIARLVEELIHSTGATQCILVTDGGEDEYVLPIIQGKVQISSVQRVVVSQMPNLEGTFYILKKLLSDPKISKLVLVLPGLTLLLYAVSYALSKPEVATIIIAAGIAIVILSLDIPWFFSVLMIFGYYFFYEYAIVSRCYGLTALLLFLAARDLRKDGPSWRIGFMLGLSTY